MKKMWDVADTVCMIVVVVDVAAMLFAHWMMTGKVW